FEPHVSDREPLGFYSGGDQIVASTASLKFLFEITLAQRWLEMNGFDTATVNQYLTMVRYWDAKRDRPPKPLETLCIPPNLRLIPKSSKVPRAYSMMPPTLCCCTNMVTRFIVIRAMSWCRRRNRGRTKKQPIFLHSAFLLAGKALRRVSLGF